MFKNINVLVCGGSSGIGLSTAILFSELDANVTLFSSNIKKLENALTKLKKEKYQKHKILIGDFNKPLQIKDIIDKDIKNNQYSVLINNSGGPKGGGIIKAELNEFTDTFNRHLLCTHILTKALLPKMKINKYGRIINIISTSIKQPIVGLGVSNTIRGAVASWTKTLSMEIGDYGITINNILPGYTNTERLNEIIKMNSIKKNKSIEQIKVSYLNQIPLKRFAKPSEIANAICFIASTYASYINGVSLPIDGGRITSL